MICRLSLGSVVGCSPIVNEPARCVAISDRSLPVRSCDSRRPGCTSLAVVQFAEALVAVPPDSTVYAVAAHDCVGLEYVSLRS